jgi:hypothetical protein
MVGARHAVLVIDTPNSKETERCEELAGSCNKSWVSGEKAPLSAENRFESGRLSKIGGLFV